MVYVSYIYFPRISVRLQVATTKICGIHLDIISRAVMTTAIGVSVTMESLPVRKFSVAPEVRTNIELAFESKILLFYFDFRNE